MHADLILYFFVDLTFDNHALVLAAGQMTLFITAEEIWRVLARFRDLESWHRTGGTNCIFSSSTKFRFKLKSHRKAFHLRGFDRCIPCVLYWKSQGVWWFRRWGSAIFCHLVALHSHFATFNVVMLSLWCSVTPTSCSLFRIKRLGLHFMWDAHRPENWIETGNPQWLPYLY